MYGNNTNSKDKDIINHLQFRISVFLCINNYVYSKKRVIRVIKKPEKPQRQKECWLERKSMEEEPEKNEIRNETT